MKVYFLFLLLASSHIDTSYCDTFQIFQPSVIKEMFSNSTRAFSQYVKSRSLSVSNTFNDYLDVAKNQSAQLKNCITNFFDGNGNSINESASEKVDSVKNASVLDNLMDFDLFKSKLDCPVDPDIVLNTPQIIQRNGYAAESHTIQTEDGYLLTLHRIPRAKNSPPGSVGRQAVLLHHGLLASSADWIIGGPNQALAYILADEGYDVWMANVRGNTYSRAHVNLSSSDKAFWNFTWHEVGYYDLPASIDYINGIKKTDKDIIYIGHSMGTSVLFVLLSTRPEYNQRLKAGFAFAPVAYMSAIKSPIRLLAPYANDLELLSSLLGAGEFLPQNLILKWLARYGCEINHYEEKICENSLFVLCGYDAKQFNRSLIPVILSHTPAGASTKSLVHFAQEIEAKGMFQQFDYGAEGNMIKYGKKTPPAYPLNQITLPIGLFTANNDWLSASADAKALYKQLANPIEYYEVPMEEFNHLDFLWAVDAPKLVYKRLLESMSHYKAVKGILWSFDPKNGMNFRWNGQ